MPNPYVNKVVYGTTVLVDLTGDTVTADKLMQGYTAHDRSGALITGTASATGGVIQDQDGYLVLDDDTPTPTPRGLEYETGTWTPSEDVQIYAISLSNTHTVAPAAYVVYDADDSTVQDNSNIICRYLNYAQMCGVATTFSGTTTYYGQISYASKSTGTSAGSGNTYLLKPYTDTSDGNNGCSRFYATETSIKAYGANSTRYWRSGRTYKWMAVWAPTS